MLRDLLAPFWRWPLQSPRRFVAVAMLVAATLGGVGIARVEAHRSTDRAATGVPKTTPVVAAARAHSPAATTPPTDRPTERTATASAVAATPDTATVAASHAAQLVAASFVRTWASHAGVPRSTWQGRVTRYADPEFASELKNVAPDNVPASEVTGPPHATTVRTSAATVAVPTDAGWQDVTLINDGHAWQVTGILPQQK
jgi:hypothetical protein